MPVTRNDENCSILARYRGGDKAALTELCEKNKNLVISEAKKVFFDGMELEDIVNEGWIGFLSAVEEFDAERNRNFAFFAWLKTRQHLYRMIQANHYKSRRSGISVELDDNAIIAEFDDEQMPRYVREAVERLPTDERAVITALYFNGELLADLVDRLNMPRRRVQRLEANALETLREALG